MSLAIYAQCWKPQISLRDPNVIKVERIGQNKKSESLPSKGEGDTANSTLLKKLLMSWRCSGRTNKELIENLCINGIIKSPQVKAAMLQVDRAQFCDINPYEDSPQSIGSNATISAPHMHAYALEILLPYLKRGSKVLDVGCGSGFLLPCFSKLVGESGLVIGIDHVESLTSRCISNLRKGYQKELASGEIKVLLGDGRLGDEENAPFDAIHVGAAAYPIPSKLNYGGCLLIPVGLETQDQHMQKIVKDATGKIKVDTLFGVRYIPLTDACKQIKNM